MNYNQNNGNNPQQNGYPQQPAYAQPQGYPQQPVYNAPQQPPQGYPQQPVYNAPQQAPQGYPQQPPYGAPQQAPQGYPQQPAYGAPQQTPQGYPQQPPYNAPQQGGYQQPAQGAAPQNQRNGNNQPQQGQGEKVNYTPAIYEKPESGQLADLVMTLVLGINTTQSLYFNKFLSRNGNPCVGVSADVVLGDGFVGSMFGQHMVRPDHVVNIQFSLAGHAAKNFLEHTPSCTKNLVVQLKEFSVQSFNKRDGSQGTQIRANCVGLQVIHYSSKHKASEVKQCNLGVSSPYTIKDNTGNAAPQGGGYAQQPQNYGAPQQGYPQQAPNAFGPGVETFSPMDSDDGELPF